MHDSLDLPPSPPAVAQHSTHQALSPACTPMQQFLAGLRSGYNGLGASEGHRPPPLSLDTHPAGARRCSRS